MSASSETVTYRAGDAELRGHLCFDANASAANHQPAAGVSRRRRARLVARHDGVVGGGVQRMNTRINMRMPRDFRHRVFMPRGFMRTLTGVLFIATVSLASPARTQTSTVEVVLPALTGHLAQAAADAVQTIAAGAWVKSSYRIAGRWSIVARDGVRTIEFDDDFKTRRGPDLKVYLSKLTVEELTDSTVAANSVEIAALQSHRGAQVYEIPAALDLDDYRSVLIHCKRFAHLWGGGNFAPN